MVGYGVFFPHFQTISLNLLVFTKWSGIVSGEPLLACSSKSHHPSGTTVEYWDVSDTQYIGASIHIFVAISARSYALALARACSAPFDYSSSTKNGMACLQKYPWSILNHIHRFWIDWITNNVTTVPASKVYRCLNIRTGIVGYTSGRFSLARPAI